MTRNVTEPEMIVRTRATGGSLVVTIPKEIAEQESIREGEVIKIRVKKIRKSAFGILKGIRSFTKQDELKTHEIRR